MLEVAAEVPAHPRRLRAVRCGAARRGSLVVPHAGRRSVSLLDYFRPGTDRICPRVGDRKTVQMWCGVREILNVR